MAKTPQTWKRVSESMVKHRKGGSPMAEEEKKLNVLGEIFRTPK